MINKEKSKTLRIRGSVWLELKVLAARKKVFMLDLAEGFLKAGIEEAGSKEGRKNDII